MHRLREIAELTRVRVLLFVREPEAMFWVLVFPLVLTGVLGFAFREGGVSTSRVGVVSGELSEEVSGLLESAESLELVEFEREDAARKKLFTGAIDVLVLPGEALQPLLVLDPERDGSDVARLRVSRALEPDPVESLDVEPVDENGARYVDFLFPGILGMNLMGTGLWGIGFALAQVRQKRFLKRLYVTPMRHSSFFLSFMLSRLVFLLAEVLILVAFAVWVLRVPMRGNLASFAVVCAAGSFAFAGLGVLVASRARTIEGVSGILNLVMMPMWLGSGVFFSYERFPDAAQPVLRVLPLSSLNDGLRAVMLEGVSLGSLGLELALLMGWGLFSLVLALRIFRWE